ncbi:MAG TPA: helix-hairpin-helix domain-containing protein [Candidatus Saccharimonadaceae bacterium]|jgi:DNA uptake protein ComE-like DNA-binding protein|nr:helix-hairpin-helix domain-containing protein [Candidatus Saccharimonadaceae bacterium]
MDRARRLRRLGFASALALIALAAATHSAWAGADSTAIRARVAAVDSLTAPVDLNLAPLDVLKTLPLPAGVAEGIVDRRTFIAPFTSLFELLEVPGMTPEALDLVRDRVTVAPRFQRSLETTDEEAYRAGEMNSLVQRLLAEEGASEGLVDEYVDAIRQPRDLNALGFFDLTSYQNVSPVDAVAILRERGLSGRIENARALRAVPGLSGWGYRNLRDYVAYAPPAGPRRLHADYQIRVYDTPYVLDQADILNENIVGDTQGVPTDQKDAFRDPEINTYGGRLRLGTTDPAMTEKLRLRWGPAWRAGALVHRNVGEHDWAETAKGYVALDEPGALHTPLGPVQVHNAVLGNYTATFGQGLVFDATDFFMSRRTGAGYGVRSIGVRGDNSRSDEFRLFGGAFEGSLGPVRATLLGSWAKKDAILNPDGSFNRYIVMVPRLENDVLSGIRDDIRSGTFAGHGDTSSFLAMRHVMDERVMAANVKTQLRPGTWLGVTGVEIRTRNTAFDGPLADRWDPRPSALVIDPARIEDRDAEIGAGYDSRNLGDYRRIWGAEGQGVWRNVSVAGEYGKLETSPSRSAWTRIFSRGPEAFVANASAQFENLTTLVLYRDYDVGFDDPYSRPFSEDARYEQTILDANAFRLKNPYWAELAPYLPQPKAERGWYLDSRYQFAREFLVSGFEFDSWKRKADDADLYRAVGRLEYRPIFPIRVRLRHSVSGRHADRADDARAYRAWDSRLELLANLSHYDQMRFLYSTGNVTFAARGRLYGPAAGGDTQSDSTASRGGPAHALQAQMTHQFNNDLAVVASTELYDGFLYNYEDNEFVVVDGKGFRNWVMVRSRLSPALSWRLKWTHDHPLARTFVDIRSFGSLVPPTPDASNVLSDASAFRFQLDLSF